MPALVIALLTSFLPLLPNLVQQITAVVDGIRNSGKIDDNARKLIHDLMVAANAEAKRLEDEQLAAHPPA